MINRKHHLKASLVKVPRQPIFGNYSFEFTYYKSFFVKKIDLLNRLNLSISLNQISILN